jgi:ABC-2 type transport system ATP-binding protein
MEKVLHIERLTKSYGNLIALDNLSLEVKKGQILGLLGPNGSGKTTTLGIILGTLFPDSGEYSWFGKGKDSHQLIKVGSLLETPNFYPYLHAYDNLKIIAHIKGVEFPNFDKILAEVNLLDRAKSPFMTYSFGMKQRLAIAAALIGDPEVLIFDEPTNGLDPEGIKEIREIILRIANTGKTIIMASHILDEVEKICTHVAILKKGKLLAFGPVGSIINQKTNFVLATLPENTNSLFELLQNQSWSEDLLINENQQIELVSKIEITGDQINSLCFKNHIVLKHLQEKKKRLEEEFLEIIQNNPS